MSKGFHIDDWLVQPSLNKVSYGDESWKLEPKIMDVLIFLVENKGNVVSRETLLENIWKDTVVVDMVVTRAISELRSVFKDNPSNPTIIETIPKKGYRLIASVTLSEEEKKSSKTKKINSYTLLSAFVFIIVFIFSGILSSSKENKKDVEMLDIKPLTSLKGWEFNPSISPDGKSVVFVWKENNNTYNLCTKSLEDESVKILVSSNHMYFTPVWSENHMITYYKNNNGKVSICTIPSYGGKEEELIKVNSQLAGLSWSDDGETLAFVDNDSVNQKSVIKLFHRDSKKIEILTSPPKTTWGDSHPRFSFSEDTIAFIRTVSEGNQDIYMINIKTREETKITSYSSNIYGFDWKEKDRITLSSNYQGNAMMFDFDIKLKKETKLPLGLNNQNPVVKNNLLVAEQWTQNVDLWKVDLSNGSKNIESTISSTKFDLYPNYSNNGQNIVFVSNRSGSYELWISNKEGKELKKITSIGSSLISNPKWSPDDKLIAFNTKEKGKSNIFFKKLNNIDIISFTDASSNDIAPSWSKNGKWLYFASDRSKKWQIWKKSVNNGGHLEQITTRGGYYAQESKDGKYLYYSKFKKSGIWQLDLITKKEEKIIDSLSKVDYANWVLVPKGIFYVKRNRVNTNTSEIKFHNIGNGSEHLVMNTLRPIPTHDNGIAVSSDGKIILYGQVNGYNSDLIVVERNKK